MGAEERRRKLMKKADPARRRRKERGSEVSKPPTLRVYKEGCPPSSRMAFLSFFFTEPLCYISRTQVQPPSVVPVIAACGNPSPTEPEPYRTRALPNLNPSRSTHPSSRTRSYPEPTSRHGPDSARYRLEPGVPSGHHEGRLPWRSGWPVC